MTRTSLIGLFVAAAAAGDPATLGTPADTRSLTFEKVSSAAGNFSVEMPGRPTETSKNYPGKATLHTFAVEAAGPSVFRIEYLDFVGDQTARIREPQQSILAYRGGFREGKTFEGDKEIALGPEKTPGREYSLEAQPGVFVRERMYSKDGRIYVVHIVATNKDFLNSAAANQFFDSFRITGRPASWYPGPAAAEPTAFTFQKFSSPTGRFTGLMPGRPTESVEKHAFADLHIFAAGTVDVAVFRIEYLDPPAGPFDSQPPQQSLTNFINGFRHDKKLQAQKELSLGPDKIPGREYVLEAQPGLWLREQVYLTPGRIFIVDLVGYKSEKILTSALADRFFNSFSITSARPQPAANPPAGPQPARVLIRVPPQARVWVENTPLTQTGADREMVSPPLDPSQKYHYTVKAEWVANGQTMTQERTVNIQGGQTSTVDFTAPEASPPPAAKPPSP